MPIDETESTTASANVAGSLDTENMATQTGTAPADLPPPGGVLNPRYRWVSIGMCALIMLSAFEALAVTTIMPTVSRELDGAGLYAFAFAGPLAVSVVGMVLAGAWSDRGNPRNALFASVGLFVIGLLIAGTATSMGAFVAGRLVHGFGGGALTVALYVIVARVYPPVLHARIFAGFAAAWVIPSLIGPVIAGLLSDTVGWRWVFLGVVALVVLAMLMVVPAMRGVHAPDATSERPPWDIRRIGWAVLVAVAVLVLNLAADVQGAVQWIAPVLGIAVALFALRPLLPKGTLRAARGLPSVILLRSIVAGTFFASEVYVPYLLVSQHQVSPTLAGLALTAAGLSWSAASWVQGRYPQITHRVTALAGAIGLSIAVASLLATAILDLAPAVVIVGWAFAGAGMGIVYPRLGVLTLEYSTIENQGFNSSALSIADAIGSAIALAVAAIVFSALGPLGGGWPFAGAFALAAVLCVAAFGAGPRILRR
ncbi:MFS transporter [Leifsonia poae]|uniref:MFS transporter n=2 Tax=Leifsonia poae TaxID=110933 RepID=A0A9W6M082_9MICO|nr:MFS transporter [Leifsonia poae]GLJ76650.1 MFS transporter [Leifsonia poae]